MMKMSFVYLIFIYFYKIKKNIYETKKLTSLQGFKKEKGESHRTNRTTVLVFYICTRQVYPFKLFLKRTVQKENKPLTKNP